MTGDMVEDISVAGGDTMVVGVAGAGVEEAMVVGDTGVNENFHIPVVISYHYKLLL